MESKATERKATADAKGSSSSSTTTKDIWLLLSSMEPTSPSTANDSNNELLTTAQQTNDERDTFTLIIGSKSAGKTSLCNAYVHRNDDKSSSSSSSSTSNDDVKPTTGLEYLYVRQNGAVAHIWELASSRCVPEMMRVPLAPERIFQSAVVLVLDLSTPGDVIPHLIKWLSTVHKIVGDVLKAKEKNPIHKPTVDRLKRAAMDRYGNGNNGNNSHADTEDVTPIAIPVLVLANKYDLFAKEDSVRRKPLVQAIRFFAHLYGASLLFTTTKEKPSVLQLRSVLKTYLFGISTNLQNTKKEIDSAASKPVFVPAGSDSFADIGLPEGARKEDLFTMDATAGGGDAKVNKPWKKYVAKVFPASGAVADGWEEEGNDKDKNKKEPENEFPEPNVDRARQRKADELVRYRDARKKLEKKKK